jgi:Na+:H+ antiporter, NhaA family
LKDPSRPRGPSVFERLLRPLQVIRQAEWTGGAALLAATLLALIWANSPWESQYEALWAEEVHLQIGDSDFRATLRALVSDGLLALFFFVIGLEIKRELLVGELATRRKAALPLAAALGGLVVPAAIFLALNAAGEGSRGWGIPTATDIAFVHGVFALLGQRTPAALSVFLGALAIVDDIGAVVVSSVFYLGDVSWGPLVFSAFLLALAAAANKAGVRTPWIYGSIGVALWMAIAASGVHATISGILMAATIPVRRRISPQQFLKEARDTLHHFERAYDPREKELNNEERHEALQGLKTLLSHAQPPLVRIERALRRFVFVVVIPIFAFANAGVSLGPESVSAALDSPVALGIILGLVLGKPLGIAAAAWLVLRVNLADAPEDVSWHQILGVAWLGGIGLSISLFMARLAYDGNVELAEASQLGILAGSAVAGLVGAGLIYFSAHERRRAKA